METIRVLAEQIGPRPACSQAERRAAQWCAGQLGELGYEVVVEEFPSRPSYQPWFAIYIGLAFAGALLVVVVPLIACLLGIVSFIFYSRDAEGRPLISPRTGTSRNVVARNCTLPRVVVLAHLDSAYSSLMFHPRLVRFARASARTLSVTILLVVALGAGAYVAGSSTRLDSKLRIPAVALAAVLGFAIFVQLRSMLAKEAVPGANDNASGVEVLMRIAAEDPPDAWFVLTGSKEAGTIGVQRFIDSHGAETAGAWFLNIDNVGRGRLIAADEEGVVGVKEANAHMVRAAEAAGAHAQPWRGLPTDATVLLGRKFQALTLIALDDRGVPPNWHWRTDTVDNVDAEALDLAIEVAKRVVAARTLQRAPESGGHA